MTVDRMTVLIGLLTAAFFTFGLAKSAEAATIKIQTDERGDYILYAGTVEYDTCEKWLAGYSQCLEIVPRDSFRINKLLQSYPHIRRIKMSSGGGVASEGYAIGHLLRQHGVVAEVPKGAYCLSACAIAFSGAVGHEINGVLGYHATWTTARNIMPIQAMAAGQSVATQRAKYLIMMGYHYDLMDIIANGTSPSVFFVFKDTESFSDFYVGVRDGVWGLLVPKEYDEEYFRGRFMEGKTINEYVVAQRMESLVELRSAALEEMQDEGE